MPHWVVLCLYTIVTIGALACTALLSPVGKNADASALDTLSLVEIATLVGGRRCAAEVIVAWMFEEGIASVNESGKDVFVDGSRMTKLPTALGGVDMRITGYMSRIDLLDEISTALAPTQSTLIARGLLRSPINAAFGSLVCSLPLATTSILGFWLVSVFTGPLRIGMSLADAGIAAVFCVSGIGFLVGTNNTMTPVGVATERALREARCEGPLPQTLHGRVAFFGPDQLRGTPFAAYTSFPSEHAGPA